MRAFTCALRHSSYATTSGCSMKIDKNGIEVNHLFFSNPLTIPYENIIKIIQYKNKWIDLKIEYNNGLGKKEIVHLRVFNKKVFISYAMSLGIEVETQDRLNKNEMNKQGCCLLCFIVIAFAIAFVMVLIGIFYIQQHIAI